MVRRSYGSYNDGCAAAHALDIIGDRWVLIIVRELLLGPKRFTDLQRDIHGIGPTALTSKLKQLEHDGVVVRTRLPAPARVEVYGLTDWGQGLEAVNASLSLWAIGSPALPWDADMSPDTVVLAMRAHARVYGGTSTRRVELRLHDSRSDRPDHVEYIATMTADATSIVRIETAPSPPTEPDAMVDATTRGWKAVVLQGAPPDNAPEVSIAGDPAAVDALLHATRLDHRTT